MNLDRLRSVVVVDDMQDLREIVASQLGRAGYRVYLASNGSEALDLLREVPGPHAALITDFDMPIKNGCDLIREIDAGGLNFGFYVLLSGHGAEHKPIKELLASCTQRPLYMLSKPFKADELMQLLK